MDNYKTIVKYNSRDGRFTIPRELRRELKLDKVDRLQLTVKNNQIILEPEAEPKCDLCGSIDCLLNDVNGHTICMDCYKDIITWKATWRANRADEGE